MKKKSLHFYSPSPPSFSPCAFPCICLCCHLCASSFPCLCVFYQRSPCDRWYYEIQILKSGGFSFNYSKQKKQQKMGGMLWPRSRHQHAETCIYAEYENKHHTRCHALISPVPFPSYGPYVCVPFPCTCLYACESLKGKKKQKKTV